MKVIETHFFVPPSTPQAMDSHGVIARGYRKLLCFTRQTMGNWGLFRGYILLQLMSKTKLWKYRARTGAVKTLPCPNLFFHVHNSVGDHIENFIRWTYQSEGFWLSCFMSSFCWSILLISIMNGIAPWWKETG